MLTQRERDVLIFIAGEYSTQEIANLLYLRPHTVISHRKSILRKLCVRNTAGMIYGAFLEGIFEERKIAHVSIKTLR